VTSARKLHANRLNAHASTGPRTGAGKVRAAQNARRHGLSLPARYDPCRSGEVDALAREIAGDDADAELASEASGRRGHSISARAGHSPEQGSSARAQRRELACRIAAAQIDLVQARRARRDIFPGALREPDATTRLAAITRFAIMDRYERRAWSRRKFAIRDFDDAR